MPIGVAASGAESAQLAADQGECLIATEPDAALIEDFNQAGGEAERMTLGCRYPAGAGLSAAVP